MALPVAGGPPAVAVPWGAGVLVAPGVKELTPGVLPLPKMAEAMLLKMLMMYLLCHHSLCFFTSFAIASPRSAGDDAFAMFLCMSAASNCGQAILETNKMLANRTMQIPAGMSVCTAAIYSLKWVNNGGPK